MTQHAAQPARPAEHPAGFVVGTPPARMLRITVGPDKDEVSRVLALLVGADQTVQVNVKSVDILHSFWVPAFRQKIDAVPGQVKTIYVTPDQPGDPADVAYRLQCAELCGAGHAVMAKPVRVLESAEFGRWLASKKTAVEAR